MRIRDRNMYQVTKLENGLTVATAEMPHMTSVSFGIWVGVGSRSESAKMSGVCHFIEHLLFKGTTRRNARQISQAVEGIGGYLNAFTSEEMTCFHARAGHQHLEELMDVLVDMLTCSRFDPREIDKEREVIKEEISMYLDQPHHLVQETLNATLWPDQPLGRPITGTPKTLDGLQRSNIVQYLQNHYAANSTMFVAAGRVGHKQFVKLARRYGQRLKRGIPAEYPSANSKQTAPRVALVHKKTEQTQLALGIRTCSRHDPRRYALRLLNTILGENMSSRLFQIIREDRGLAYSIFSSPSFFADTGDLVISAGLETSHVAEALGLIIRELRNLAKKAPSPGELRRARDYIFGQIDLGSECTENQMNWLGEQLLGYGKIFSPVIVKQRLGKVSAADIRTVAGQFFRPENLILALVSPLKSARHLEKRLRF